jgi:hypothetical protein
VLTGQACKNMLSRYDVVHFLVGFLFLDIPQRLANLIFHSTITTSAMSGQCFISPISSYVRRRLEGCVLITNMLDEPRSGCLARPRVVFLSLLSQDRIKC